MTQTHTCRNCKRTYKTINNRVIGGGHRCPRYSSR